MKLLFVADPLDTFNPLNGEVIASWIGQLGGLPLIVALITVAVTGRKAGWRSLLLNGIGAIIAIPLILLPLIVATAAAFSTNDEYPFVKDGVGRRLFVKQAKSKCAEQLSRAPDISQALTDAYCSCVAGVFADTTTRTEVLRFNAQATREKGAAIGEKCRPQQ